MQRAGWLWWTYSAGMTDEHFVEKREIVKNDYFKRNHVFRAKELALADPDPQLFTMATLTGHAVLAVG